MTEELLLECGCFVDKGELCPVCHENTVQFAKMIKGKWAHLCSESCIVGAEFTVDDTEFREEF